MPKLTENSLTTLVAGTFLLLVLSLSVPAAESDPPPAVTQAIRENFPQATVQRVTRERETGVVFFEVMMRDQGHRIEAEIDEQGGIGEVEAVVDWKDVPPVVRTQLRGRIGTGQLVSVEKHERWGVARDGRFVPLQDPRIFYEAKYKVGWRRREASVQYQPSAALTAQAKAAIAAALPRSQIRDARARREQGINLFDVVAADGPRLHRMRVSVDGVVVEVADAIDPAGLAPAALAAVRQAAPDARIIGVERVEIRATLVAGRFATTPTATVAYRATLQRSGFTADLTVTPEGRALSSPVWQKLNEDGDDDEDDNGDDDDDMDE